LDSVWAQQYENVEAVVVDDCSKDATEGEMTALAAQEPRLRYLRQTQNLGGNAARNRGIEEARGELVCFLDSDDALRPDKFRKQVAHLAMNPEADLSTCQTQWFREKVGDLPFIWNRLGESHHLDGFLRLAPPWATAAPLWRIAFVRKIGGWKLGVPVAQDLEFHARAVCKGAKAVVLPEILNDYREHNQGKVSSDNSERYYKIQASILEDCLIWLAEDPDLKPHLQNVIATAFAYIGCETTLLGRFGAHRPYFERSFQLANGRKMVSGLRLAQSMASILPLTKGRPRRKLYPMFSMFGLDLDSSVWWRRYRISDEAVAD
jgi:glycosyltransferase involved in cell wall biosynthesis